MTDRDIAPDELLAALDAFMREHKLETKGAAIRTLVTDMLKQLGYLTLETAKSDPLEEPVYRSSNGDEWRMSKDAVGSVTVTHRANASSGGNETTMPAEQFLSKDKGSPEAQAVRAAIDAAADTTRPAVTLA